MKARLLQWLTPSSLFGRNLLLIVALVALAELSILLLFRQWIQEPRLLAMQQFALQDALASRTLLRALDGRGRAHWQQTVGTSRAPQADPPDNLTVQRYMRTLAAQLRPEFGDDVDLRWQAAANDQEPGAANPIPVPSAASEIRQSAPQAGLWLGLRIGQEWYWRKLDHSGIPGNLPPVIFSVSMACGLLALLAAALIQRRINQPLQELAQAAVAFGRGQRLLPDLPITPQSMPREIAQLAQAMQQMVADLDAAERERALMLAGVSHDLRTPLTKLRLAVEILGTGPLAQEDAALLQGMVAHIGAANGVIEQFIAFARSGNDEAQQEVALAELLHGTLAELAAAERAMVMPAVAELHFYCRPMALRRALVNLLENALRHAHPADTGQIELVARCERDCLLLEVLDHGPGIPAAELQRMRQPFARLEQDGARNTAGSGLGLAIVERIARLHHGQLQLLPREGGGLIARLELPLHQV